MFISKKVRLKLQWDIKYLLMIANYSIPQPKKKKKILAKSILQQDIIICTEFKFQK